MPTISEYLLVKPNWESPVAYRRKWQTTIQNSVDGSEQRSGLFTWPRRTLAFSLLSSGRSESSHILRKLYKSLHLVWGVPFWQDRTTLTAQALSGQKILQARSTSNRNFEVGGPCILLNPATLAFEPGLIDSFTSTQITLQANLASTWPAATEVYPVLQARLKTGQSWAPVGSRMGKIEIEAAEEFDSTLTRHVGASTFDSYFGFPLFDRRPNSPGREIRFSHPYDLLSFIGKSGYLSEYVETLLRLSSTHYAYTRDDLQKVLDFFDSQKGRMGAFWLPTWIDDLRITAAFGAGDNLLTIEDVGFADYFEHRELGTYITILWPDGSRACARVLDALTSTSLLLDTAVGKACAAKDLSKLLVSFLPFCRFDHDEIEVRFLTDYVAECDLSFQSLYGEAPGGLS